MSNVFIFLLILSSLLLFISCHVEGFRVFFERIRRPARLGRRRKSEVSEPICTIEGDVVVEEEAVEDENNMSSPLRESSRMLQELWEDFSLFNFSSSDESIPLYENEDVRDPEADVVHFCFLVHGHRGYSKDLSYLEAVMRKTAVERKEEEENGHWQSQHQVTNQNETYRKKQDLVVHATSCNERRTDDGVEAGGARLMEEVRSVILEEMRLRESMMESNATKQNHMPVITVSFLGNSLGGLYSRFAIAKLFENCERDPSGHLILNGRYRLYLNIFCTTATPHLGIASHTFFKIPRTAELGVAAALGQTGRDIFRVNSLIRQMATLEHFIDPMKLFRQRIAYANAYGTDFPVPVHTAAFLHDESDYPHHFVSNKIQKKFAEEHSDLCIATMYTPPQQQEQPGGRPAKEYDPATTTDDEENELAIMSRSLDSLGWKKVFVDPRKIVPKMSNPIPRLSKVASLRLNLSNSTSSNSSGSDGESMTISESDFDDDPSDSNFAPTTEAATRESSASPVPPDIDLLKARGVAPSREVFHAVTVPPKANEQFHWPFGHNMIVAMSRNSIYTYLNKSGRPIVDALAAELVDDIFAFSEEQEESSLQ